MPDDFADFLQQNAPRTDATAAPTPAPAAPAAAADPFESFLTDQKKQQDAASLVQAQAAAVGNSTTSADAAGRAASLGRELGTSPAAVETDLPRYEAQAKAQRNAQTYVDNHFLADWAAKNPDSARIAQDDLGQMSDLSNMVMGGDLWGAAKENLKDLASGIANNFNSAALAVNRSIAQGIAAQTGYDPTKAEAQSDWWYKNMIAPTEQNRQALAIPENASFGTKAVRTVGDLLGTLVQIMATGGGSAEAEAAAAVPSAAKAIGETVMHGARAMAFPSLTSALNTGQDVYDQTGDPQKAILASQMAYATSTLGGVVPLGAPGGLGTRLATGFVSGAATGEVSRQAMNLVLPQAQEFDPQQTILSGLSGAILSGAMGPSPLHDTARQAFSDGLAAETATRGGDALQKISELAAASKLREHDPEAFKKFVADAAEDSPISSVYVDGKTFADALNQSEVDPNEIPGLSDKLDEAVKTGGDVQIPIEDYATHIAGTDLDKAILPELKVEEGGMTYAEGQKFFDGAPEEMQQRAHDLVDKQHPILQEQDEADAIGEKLLDQMKATGRYPDDVARASAMPVVEFYRTMSKRLGMSPGEMFEQYPLRIAGDVGQSEALGQTATQDSVIDKAAILSKYGDTNGKIDLGKAGDGVRQDIKSALDAGAEVSLVIEGKARKIVSADSGLRDEKGQQWGVNSILQSLPNDHARLEIKYPDAQAAQPKAAARGAYSPSERTIGLLKNADLSTFLHESGHFFLHTMGDLAGREDAPEQLRNDMQTAISWMGGKDLADWNSRTLEEQRDMHEKFARGFETYLMEGKAPTAEMQSLFSRFRSWLVNVYRNLKSLNADLSPEVRGVFDRMLASDDAIRETEQQRGYFPLDLAKTGANEKQLADYQALGQKSTEDAISELTSRSLRDMKWTSNARSKVIRRMQREAAEVRGMVRAEAEQEVRATPVEQARAFIKEANLDLNPDRKEYQQAVQEWQANRAEALDSGAQSWTAGNPEPSIVPHVSGEKPNAEDRARHTEELKAWKKQRDEATAEREKQYDEQNPKPEKPITTADAWKTERAAVEKETAAQVKAEHLDRPEADGLTGIQKGQFLARARREMANETERRMIEWDQQHPRPDSSGNRVSPDFVAEQFGFGSGKELMAALREATPDQKIDRLTDQRMLERHGELTDPKAIEDAANEAVHNEARARFMATGLKLLAKSPIPVRELTKAADDNARTTIAGKQVKELNPRQYEVAETKANKEAIDKAPKDPRAALNAQRQALLSNRLAKAARDAVAEVKKIVSWQARYDKSSIRAKMDPDVLEQIDALRERFDFRKNPTDGPTKQQTQLSQWVDSQKAMGYAPVEHPDMMNPAVRMHYKDMTVEQLRGFNDTIRSLEQIARERKSVTVAGKKANLDDVVSGLVDKMKERADKFTVKDLVQPPQKGVDPFVQVALHRMSAFLRATAAELKPQQFKANLFDKQQILGPFTRAIFERVFNANYDKVTMLKTMSRSFADGAKELGKDWQNSLTELVPNTRLLDADLTKEAGEPVYRRLTRGEMLGIARHVGNESNFDKLVKGMEWEPNDVWAFLNENMRPADWRATQMTWDAFEKHWPAMVEMNKRLGNTAPERIEPRAFRTASGEEMRGGYAPIDYDANRSKLAVRKADASAINPAEGLFNKGYFRADTTTNGSLNSRAAGYYDRLDLDFHAIEKRMSDTIHDLAYREALLDVHKILTHPEFRRQFQLSYGKEQYKSMQNWVGDLANGQNSDAQMSVIAKILQQTRHMMVANGIALRVSTMIKHGGSAAFKSSGYFSGGGQKYFAARAAKMATDHANQIDGAVEKFSEIRARQLQQDRDYRETTSSLFQPESFHSKAERFGHSAVANLDLMSAVPTAWAAYDRAITEGIPVNRGGTGKPMSEDDAVAYANQIVREAHGSNIESARSAVLQNKNEAVKMFTMMYGFMNNSLGQGLDMADKLRTAGFSKPEVLSRFVMAIIVPALAAGVVEKQHKDEGWAEWAGKAIAGEVGGMVPLVREMVSMAKGYSSSGVAPLVSAMQALAKPFQDIYKLGQGKEVKAPIKDLGNAIGLAIPGGGQVGTTLQYATDLARGKQHPKNVVDVARGLALGQGNE